ncbi:hypothetical protein HPB51_027716 [Rhipicephalus microplus]|uniref:Uncharacterized protein n=1 Tax=Rhipicephalus microplus TaxID=6941 RepID=A0A9J6CZ88_RHIMP|nr:hypothetical protein HPB51_027716 [Rhipicephalus microplus]
MLELPSQVFDLHFSACARRDFRQVTTSTTEALLSPPFNVKRREDTRLRMSLLREPPQRHRVRIGQHDCGITISKRRAQGDGEDLAFVSEAPFFTCGVHAECMGHRHARPRAHSQSASAPHLCLLRETPSGSVLLSPSAVVEALPWGRQRGKRSVCFKAGTCIQRQLPSLSYVKHLRLLTEYFNGQHHGFMSSFLPGHMMTNSSLSTMCGWIGTTMRVEYHISCSLKRPARSCTTILKTHGLQGRREWLLTS